MMQTNQLKTRAGHFDAANAQPPILIAEELRKAYGPREDQMDARLRQQIDRQKNYARDTAHASRCGHCPSRCKPGVSSAFLAPMARGKRPRSAS